MKTSTFSKLLAFASITTVMGCGGGGGSNEPSNPEVGQLVCLGSGTTDPFNANSYNSCLANNSDLTGIWMLVWEYQGTGTSPTQGDFSFNVMARETFSIKQVDAGVLTIKLCNSLVTFNNPTIDVQSNEVVFEGSGFPMRKFNLSIVNNTQLTGDITPPSDEYSISNSSASAVKILDLPTEGEQLLGTVGFDYTDNGQRARKTGSTVDCFSHREEDVDYVYQSHGTRLDVVFDSGNLKQDLDPLLYIAHLSLPNEGVEEPQSVLILHAEAGLSPLIFGGSTDTSADLSEISNRRISGTVSATSDHSTSDTLLFEFDLNFQI